MATEATIAASQQTLQHVVTRAAQGVILGVATRKG
jgi:hypothetical protein